MNGLNACTQCEVQMNCTKNTVIPMESKNEGLKGNVNEKKYIVK